jgi:hypothetical protein
MLTPSVKLDITISFSSQPDEALKHHVAIRFTTGRQTVSGQIFGIGLNARTNFDRDNSRLDPTKSSFPKPGLSAIIRGPNRPY